VCVFFPPCIVSTCISYNIMIFILFNIENILLGEIDVFSTFLNTIHAGGKCHTNCGKELPTYVYRRV